MVSIVPAISPVEAAVRSAYHGVNGGELPLTDVTELRSFDDIRSAKVSLGGGLPPVTLAD